MKYTKNYFPKIQNKKALKFCSTNMSVISEWSIFSLCLTKFTKMKVKLFGSKYFDFFSRYRLSFYNPPYAVSNSITQKFSI